MFHQLLLQLIFWIIAVFYSMLMGSIPFAIAGRGNRLLWLLVAPCVLVAWLGLGGLVSLALKGKLNAGTVDLVTYFFYLSVPAVLCVSAWMFRSWRQIVGRKSAAHSAEG